MTFKCILQNGISGILTKAKAKYFECSIGKVGEVSISEGMKLKNNMRLNGWKLLRYFGAMLSLNGSYEHAIIARTSRK